MFGTVLGLFGMERVNWIGASFIVHFGSTHPSTYYLKNFSSGSGSPGQFSAVMLFG